MLKKVRKILNVVPFSKRQFFTTTKINNGSIYGKSDEYDSNNNDSQQISGKLEESKSTIDPKESSLSSKIVETFTEKKNVKFSKDQFCNDNNNNNIDGIG